MLNVRFEWYDWKVFIFTFFSCVFVIDLLLGCFSPRHTFILWPSTWTWSRGTRTILGMQVSLEISEENFSLFIYILNPVYCFFFFLFFNMLFFECYQLWFIKHFWVILKILKILVWWSIQDFCIRLFWLFCVLNILCQFITFLLLFACPTDM